MDERVLKRTSINDTDMRSMGRMVLQHQKFCPCQIVAAELRIAVAVRANAIAIRAREAAFHAN
jgi:hypothetical protein